MRRGHPGLVLAGVVIAASVSTASAQDIHKCVVDGHVAFQAAPCPQEASDEVVHVNAERPTAADAAAAAARVKAEQRVVSADKPAAATSAARRPALPASGASAAPHHRR